MAKERIRLGETNVHVAPVATSHATMIHTTVIHAAVVHMAVIHLELLRVLRFVCGLGTSQRLNVLLNYLSVHVKSKKEKERCQSRSFKEWKTMFWCCRKEEETSR